METQQIWYVLRYGDYGEDGTQVCWAFTEKLEAERSAKSLQEADEGTGYYYKAFETTLYLATSKPTKAIE